MRFALLGDHPDGLDVSRALVRSGRHALACYTGPPAGLEELRRRGLEARPVTDLEEVLADPAVEAVVVASPLAVRPEHLRRALQSERHVLCVHPADDRPDAAYEAALIQGDTGKVLLPLLPAALHPAVGRLGGLAASGHGPLGRLRLLEAELRSPAALPAEGPAARVTLPGWDVLRAVGGEVAEVSAFAAAEELTAGEPALLAGRFEPGGLFQAALLPLQPERRWRLRLTGAAGEAELAFPAGWPGPARLTWSAAGDVGAEEWPAWDPWPALVEAFDAAVAGRKNDRPSWQDAVRCLELDDAARRSAERRRTSLLEYQEASEEVGFKGTMTLVGCGLMWAMLLLLIVSAWVPVLRRLVLPVLGTFLLLQLLLWVTARRPRPGPDDGSARPGQ